MIIEIRRIKTGFIVKFTDEKEVEVFCYNQKEIEREIEMFLWNNT